MQQKNVSAGSESSMFEHVAAESTVSDIHIMDFVSGFFEADKSTSHHEFDIIGMACDSKSAFSH